MNKSGFSVIIPTFNAEFYLARLLDAVMPWAQEIIVCDSFSQDRTVKIAETKGARIVQQAYETSAKQKNWAIPQARHDWVLIIDADELPEPGLMQEIRRFVDSAPAEIELAHIPRKNLFWGKWLGKASNYPDYQSRLFRRDAGRYQEKEVHAQVSVRGKCVHLHHALIHDDFTDISSWWLRNNRYYRYELAELKKKAVKWNWKLQFVKPAYIFIRLYFFRGGILHGFPGLFVSLQWFVYHFFVAAKLYEDQLKEHQSIHEKFANPN